jgi:3-oxoadipate enol-lactonase
VTTELNKACSADGKQIVYRLMGRHDGNARIALVHSLAMDHSFWDPVAEHVAESASVLSLDCRGHGRSDKPPGPYTVELFARDLADLMTHVGWSSAVVAGASMGGCVSLAFAAAYPERVRGLGLFDTTAWYGPEAPQQWAERADRALAAGLADLVEFQTTRWFGDRFRQEHPDIVQRCVDVFMNNDVKAYAETCRMLGACDLRAALPHIRVPVRILVGEEDYATPVKMAEELHAGIAGSILAILPKARHLTPLEEPQRIAAELKALLADTGKARASMAG